MIAAFVAGRMASYISGGMNPETAAHFTHSELEAIYGGNHYSRDKSGAMHLTPPPEALDPETAKEIYDEGIREILDYYTGNANKEHRASTVVEKAGTHGFAPDSVTRTEKKNGLEGLKEYIRRETA